MGYVSMIGTVHQYIRNATYVHEFRQIKPANKRFAVTTDQNVFLEMERVRGQNS